MQSSYDEPNTVRRRSTAGSDDETVDTEASRHPGLGNLSHLLTFSAPIAGYPRVPVTGTQAQPRWRAQSESTRPGTQLVDRPNAAVITTLQNPSENPQQIIPVRQPNQGDYADLLRYESNRLATFNHWPKNHVVRAERLAKAGLFFSGVGDKATCRWCRGSMRNWASEDDPMVEHRRYFGTHCAFVKGEASDNIPIGGSISAVENRSVPPPPPMGVDQALLSGARFPHFANLAARLGEL